jgi:ribosomal protein L40E
VIRETALRRCHLGLLRPHKKQRKKWLLGLEDRMGKEEKEAKQNHRGSGEITKDFASKVKQSRVCLKCHGKLVKGFNQGSDLI